MLQSRCYWSSVLGENAKAFKPIFGVMMFNVGTDKINIKKMEKSINIIKEYNKELKSLKAINIF